MAKAAKKAASAELIISKSRTKGAAKGYNVSSDFYPALDKAVRAMIRSAGDRAKANKRKTLKPSDL
jgi:histone H3/H4